MNAFSGAGAIALVGVLIIAIAWALIDRRRSGRFRKSADYLEWEHRLGEQLGRDATFVQFSSAFCAPCRATRLILEGVAQEDPAIKHIEIDAESHLDLVRELGILSTPTTIVLDREGKTVARSVGAPRRDQVRLLLQGIRNSQSSEE